MRWSDRLNLAQRIVVIIGLGLALAVAADYLTSLVTEAGWYAYSPLTRPVISQSATGEPGWLRMIIWLAAISLWSAASATLLRQSPEHAVSK